MLGIPPNGIIRYINPTVVGISPAPPTDSFLLLESGDFLLLEDSGKIILEG